jgi:crossover junction endodeoxyribonuclease RuvC
LLHVQSNRGASKAALRPLHGCGHNFAIFYQRFRDPEGENVASACRSVDFCNCIMNGAAASMKKNPIGGCSLFVLIRHKMTRTGADMRVIGIDPGLRNLGWGVIDVAGARITHVANGICHTASGGDDLAQRLCSLHVQLTEVFRTYAPESAAVEHTFVNKDAVATLKLGQARGIALLVPAQFGLAVGEYAPNAVKKTVVGVGHAAKVQVDHMVRLHLPGVQIAGPDAADALAIAICHAHHVQSSGRLEAALKRAAG